MEFLHEFHKIPSNQPNETHVYAMKRDIGNGLWIPRLQSTLYYSKLWQNEIDAPQGTMDNAPLLTGKTHVFSSGVSTIRECLESCAGEAVTNKHALRTIRFDNTDESCRCFYESLFEWRFDSNDTANQLWVHSDNSEAEWYDVKYCSFVRPDTVINSHLGF